MLGARIKNGIAPGVSAMLLLGAIVLGGLQERSVPGTDAYHARIREGVRAIPSTIGEWVGVDVEPMPSAIDLLDPVVILQRRYSNQRTHQTLSLLVVHCGDVRRLYGHFPPNCYPSVGGWELRRAELDHATILGQERAIMRYAFDRESLGRAQNLSVLNFMVSPSRTSPVVADMDSLMRASPSRLTPGLGAGQVQILGLDALDANDRQEALGVFLQALEPALHIIAEGA